MPIDKLLLLEIGPNLQDQKKKSEQMTVMSDEKAA